MQSWYDGSCCPIVAHGAYKYPRTSKNDAKHDLPNKIGIGAEGKMLEAISLKHLSFYDFLAKWEVLHWEFLHHLPYSKFIYTNKTIINLYHYVRWTAPTVLTISSWARPWGWHTRWFTQRRIIIRTFQRLWLMEVNSTLVCKIQSFFPRIRFAYWLLIHLTSYQFSTWSGISANHHLLK